MSWPIFSSKILRFKNHEFNFVSIFVSISSHLKVVCIFNHVTQISFDDFLSYRRQSIVKYPKLFELRGATLSDGERKELNLKAGRLLKSLGINVDVKDDEYDELRELEYVGYAEYYLRKCWDGSELKNKADVTVYKQLLEIDSKQGTTQSEQLLKCVFYSVRMDLIKV